MITPSNEITRHFERLGLKIKIHAPVRPAPRSRHTIEYLPGGTVPLERFEALMTYYFEDVTSSVAFDEVMVRISTFNPAGHGHTGVCKMCGCTDGDACYDSTTGTCWWVKEDLCSACATKPEINEAKKEMARLFKEDGK